MYSRMLIATDGSELGTKAVQHGLDLAKQLRASVAIVFITEPAPALAMADEGAFSTVQEYQEAAAAAARNILDHASALAKNAGLEARLLNPTSSSPAIGIIDTAAETGADLIVMASHGRSGLKRLVLGSQASRFLVRSTIPVLVLRFPHEPAGEKGTKGG